MNSITSRHATGSGTRSVGELVDRFDQETICVLSVWAHPDDETLVAGGLLGAFADRGAEIVTVTATAGEHGTDDPVAHPPVELAGRRVGELDAALAVLGASPAIHLGYGDGSCATVTESLAAHLIGRIIDRVEPDLIVSFGPDGVTGHPDHLAVHAWVQRAVAERDHSIPLLHATAAAVWPDAGIERLHTVDAFWPGYPVGGAADDGFDVTLDADLLERKLAALSCHRSQMEPLAAALGPPHLVDLAAVECYVPANQAARRRLSQQVTPTPA